MLTLWRSGSFDKNINAIYQGVDLSKIDLQVEKMSDASFICAFKALIFEEIVDGSVSGS